MSKDVASGNRGRHVCATRHMGHGSVISRLMVMPASVATLEHDYPLSRAKSLVNVRLYQI